MSDLTIKTSHRLYPVISYVELTRKEQREFTYLTEEEHFDSRFFRYKGWVYDVQEFSLCSPSLKERGWQGQMSDSFFSGIVIKFRDDNGWDCVIPGTFFC